MLAKVSAVAQLGLNSIGVEVEVNAVIGTPGITIVGLPSKAVQESQERVKTALSNCGVRVPPRKVLINLAPADIPKEGPNFDLPIAIGIVQASELIKLPSHQDILFLGELSLTGEVRKVKGVLPAVMYAINHGFKHIVIPEDNLQEVEILTGITIHPVRHIMQLIEHFETKQALPTLTPKTFTPITAPSYLIDFADVHGQELAKKALEIAAAGGHNVLMNGSPGSGKSMLAKAFSSILPPLSETEAIEVTTIYSISGRLNQGMMTTRPFRSPHHTISQVGLVGGGTQLKPGEISLAHRGVLFLDEFPEFSSTCIESLRQPLEDHQVNIVRASGSTTYPANFTLIAAANPCPCGHRYSRSIMCTCSPLTIERYLRKLSGPILDRIDLIVIVHPVEKDKLLKHSPTTETSAQIRARVITARARQAARYADNRYLLNSELPSQAVKHYCQMTEAARQLLDQAMIKFNVSARGYFKIIKVAQTVADLDESDMIEAVHMAQALQFRTNTLV